MLSVTLRADVFISMYTILDITPIQALLDEEHTPFNPQRLLTEVVWLIYAVGGCLEYTFSMACHQAKKNAVTLCLRVQRLSTAFRNLRTQSPQKQSQRDQADH